MNSKKEINNLSLSLFNSVLSGTDGKASFCKKHGVYVPANAEYATETILSFISEKSLSGEDLNRTFYSSWQTVLDSSRFELFIDQILHYMSTYGTNFEGEVYIPKGELDIPKKDVLLIYKIGTYTENELKEKALQLLQSGLALTTKTLNDVISLLDALEHKFSYADKIKNKEALVIIADKFFVYPESTEEFLRYVVFKATESTLLIKSEKLIEEIKQSNFDVSYLFNEYGLSKLAAIFNRFKPIFLAFKYEKNKAVINKISKMSKKLHKPMVNNSLNKVTQELLTDKDNHWLENATVYALLKALFACYSRVNGQKTFIYMIRNGKGWVKTKDSNFEVCKANYNFIISFMNKKFNGKNKVVYIPENVDYGLPTSEKLFIGNIPFGTKFFSEKIISGLYWKTSDGASDIDLSGISSDKKYGWDASYYDRYEGVCYSGDKTEASNGAAEYLYVKDSLSSVDFKPILLCANIYSGNKHDVEFNIILGEGDDTSYNYMMNPNNLLFNEKLKTVNRSSVCGLIQKESTNKMSYTAMFFSSGSSAVSYSGGVFDSIRDSLVEQWSNPLSLKDVLKALNFNVINKKHILVDGLNQDVYIDFDLSLNKLTKNSFVDIFK